MKTIAIIIISLMLSGCMTPFGVGTVVGFALYDIHKEVVDDND
jgi:hypothetical protein